MIRLCVCFCLAFVSVAIPLRAANSPHARTKSQNTLVWTNDDLEQLHDLSLISIVGPVNKGTSESEFSPQQYVKTQDPEWYAEQARQLQDEHERRKAQLVEYRQAIEDVENLKTATSGINLDKGNIGITPEAGIEILQQRLNETQSDLDALEDLARRNGIPPGILRSR